jgi:predicted methyltransferase MtxX (methanogen marker protein 4)
MKCNQQHPLKMNIEAAHFLDIKSETSKMESTSILSSHRKEDIARNKHIVKKIIEVLILYGRQKN